MTSWLDQYRVEKQEVEAKSPSWLDQYKSKQGKQKGADFFTAAQKRGYDVKKPQSGVKRLISTIAQPFIGALELTTPALAFELAKTGGDLDSEDIANLIQAHQIAGKEFDPDTFLEEYDRALAANRENFPGVGTLERAAEDVTGVDFSPQDEASKLLRTAGGGYKAAGKQLPQKIAGAAVAPGVQYGLEQAGVPEGIAQLGGLGAAGLAGIATKGVKTPSFEQQVKPSGQPVRRFESLEKPVEVSERKIGKIAETIESDFKKVADPLIEQSAAGPVKAELANNPRYKSAIEDQFKLVSEIAESIPGKQSTRGLLEELGELAEKEKKGFARSEYDVAYDRFNKEFVEEVAGKEISAKELVEQYRKNNEAFGKSYESGKSALYNSAKRQALLDQNRAIAETIKSRYGEGEFYNLFKDSNEAWSKIRDAEAITDFSEQLFKNGKINYKYARDFFNKKRLQQPFRKALGEEGFEAYKQTLEDMIKGEKGFKMLKAAKDQGFTDLFKKAALYFVSPKLAKLQFASDAGKKALNAVNNMLLDKPKLALKWKKANDLLKTGQFTKAAKAFDELDRERKAD